MNPAWISHGKKKPVLLDSADLRARGAASSELCSGCPGPVGIPNITGGLGMEISGFSLNGHFLRKKHWISIKLENHWILTSGHFFEDVGCRSWVSHPFWFGLRPICCTHSVDTDNGMYRFFYTLRKASCRFRCDSVGGCLSIFVHFFRIQGIGNDLAMAPTFFCNSMEKAIFTCHQCHQ